MQTHVFDIRPRRALAGDLSRSRALHQRGSAGYTIATPLRRRGWLSAMSQWGKNSATDPSAGNPNEATIPFLFA